MALSSRKGSNLIPLTTKAPTKFHGIADTENSDREGTPTGKNGKKMINTKSYYMGTVSTQANTEPNQHSGYEDSTRAKTQVYSKKVTQDSRLHTETVDYSPRMRTTWSQNPFLDPESTHTKMMLKTAPNMLQQFDPNESFVESHRKALWSSHQNYLDKFHKSIELLNNSDKRKVPISKTVFMSKTQKELIKKFNSKGTTFTEGGPIKSN